MKQFDDLIFTHKALACTQHKYRTPTVQELEAYAKHVVREMDSFIMGKAYHKARVSICPSFVQFCVETGLSEPGDVLVEQTATEIGSVWDLLPEDIMAYIEQSSFDAEGIRLYDGPKVFIYKPAEIVYWTQEQAQTDVGELIGEIVCTLMGGHD